MINGKNAQENNNSSEYYHCRMPRLPNNPSFSAIHSFSSVHFYYLFIFILNSIFACWLSSSSSLFLMFLVVVGIVAIVNINMLFDMIIIIISGSSIRYSYSRIRLLMIHFNMSTLVFCNFYVSICIRRLNINQWDINIYHSIYTNKLSIVW